MQKPGVSGVPYFVWRARSAHVSAAPISASDSAVCSRPSSDMGARKVASRTMSRSSSRYL